MRRVGKNSKNNRTAERRGWPPRVISSLSCGVAHGRICAHSAGSGHCQTSRDSGGRDRRWARPCGSIRARRRRRADRNRFSPVRRFWRERSVPKRSFIVRGKRNGPYGRLHGTLGERNQEPANERIQTCEQSAAAISCATCSDPNGCDTRFRSGSFGAHDNLGGSKRKPLPFYRRNRIYDSADRGSRNRLF